MFVRGSARDHLDNIQAALGTAWRSPTTVTKSFPNTRAAGCRVENLAWRAAARQRVYSGTRAGHWHFAPARLKRTGWARLATGLLRTEGFLPN